MSANKKKQAPGANGQKKQLMILGGLAATLAVVIVVQFGGGEDSSVGTVKAATAADGGKAEDKGAAAKGTKSTAEASKSASTKAKVTVPPAVPNDVLSAAPVEGSIEHNPFKNFWSTTDVVQEKVRELPPPAITLNATMTGEEDVPVALIDGRMQYLGDVIQGWKLAEVRSRSVVLRAPTEEWIVVQMPLLHGRTRLPGESEDS